MLEIGIIICLAAVLFLALRNYSVSGDELKKKSGERKVISFWKNHFKKRKNEIESIQRAIEKDQDKVLSPLDLEQAGKKFLEENPEITRLLIDADRAFIENDLRGAEDMAIDVLSKEKKCGEAYVILGKVAFLRGEFEDARAAYRTALKCNMEFADAYFGLGQVELKNENYTEAIENYQRAVSLDRGSAEWWAELGSAYMEVRQFAKATKAYKKAASLDLDNKDYKQLASEAEDKQRSHSIAFRRK